MTIYKNQVYRTIIGKVSIIMGKTYVFIVVITFGTLIVIQGIRLLRRRGKTSVLPPERVLMSVFGGNNVDNQLRILGRIRIVIGIFLVVIGIWALA